MLVALNINKYNKLTSTPENTFISDLKRSQKLFSDIYSITNMGHMTYLFITAVKDELFNLSGIFRVSYLKRKTGPYY